MADGSVAGETDARAQSARRSVIVRLLRILVSLAAIVLFLLAIPDSDWRSDPRIWGLAVLGVAALMLAYFAWERWIVKRDEP